MYFKQTRTAKATSGSNQMLLIILVFGICSTLFLSIFAKIQAVISCFRVKAKRLGHRFEEKVFMYEVF